MDPSNILNDPSLTSAQSSYNTVQTAANTSGQQDITLPQMLQQSLTQSETNNNPVIQQQGKDLANYQAVTANAGADQTNEWAPSLIPYGPGGSTAPQPLPGDVQRMMVSNAQKNAAAPLNADNLILAMQNSGVLNTIHAIAASHAQETQQLTDRATLAQQNVRNILDALSTKANVALGYDQLGANLTLGLKQLQQQEHQFEQSPQQLAITEHAGGTIQKSAKGQSFGDYFSSLMNDPIFVTGAGGTQQAAQNAYLNWRKANPGEQLTPQEVMLLKSQGGSTGNLLEEWAAPFSQNTTNLSVNHLLGLLSSNPNGGGLISIGPWSL